MPVGVVAIMIVVGESIVSARPECCLRGRAVFGNDEQEHQAAEIERLPYKFSHGHPYVTASSPNIVGAGS